VEVLGTRARPAVGRERRRRVQEAGLYRVRGDDLWSWQEGASSVVLLDGSRARRASATRRGGAEAGLSRATAAFSRRPAGGPRCPRVRRQPEELEPLRELRAQQPRLGDELAELPVPLDAAIAESGVDPSGEQDEPRRFE